MKLKSKLIATIVSICAAIAVMGVGVWAAQSSFTVTVTNTVNLDFQNLAGTVKVSANAGADTKGAKAPATTEVEDFLIYDSNAQASTYVTTITAATEVADGQTFAGIADFMTTYKESTSGAYESGYIAQDTQKALVSYTFTYNAHADAKSGGIQITVDETAKPQVTSNGTDNLVGTAYYYSVDNGQTWLKLTDEVSVIAAKLNGTSTVVMVKALCQYANTSGVSVTTPESSRAWTFAVTFEAVASDTAAATTGGVTITEDFAAGTASGATFA